MNLFYGRLVFLCMALAVKTFVTTQHEPRVAIVCGRVPRHVDLDSGAWLKDSENTELCDKGPEKDQLVLGYCQKVYPTLNITNIVEASEKVELVMTDHSRKKSVTPYRCLSDGFETDALLVPDHCSFDHVHNESKCKSPHQWKTVAQQICRGQDMKLKFHGMILPCGVDHWNGVEYVCCKKQPKKKVAKKTKAKKGRKEWLSEPKKQQVRDGFSKAIQKFERHIPLQTEDCDKSKFPAELAKMEEAHRGSVERIVADWDEAEHRYLALEPENHVLASQKMNRTLIAFQETLAALENQREQKKRQIGLERSECIAKHINKQKRDAMLLYISVLLKRPTEANEVLEAVKSLIEACGHDRVHSLRHYEHVRNRNPKKAEVVRSKLVIHLKQLNKVVNESVTLIRYLPDIANAFGMDGMGAILQPRLYMPTPQPASEKDHEHASLPERVVTINPTDEPAVEKDEPFIVEDRFPPAPKKDSSVYHSSWFAAVIGLSCGAFVIVFGVLIASIVRRKRTLHHHVVIPTDDNTDQEHLVQMQKKGFENPTYKFYYY